MEIVWKIVWIVWKLYGNCIEVVWKIVYIRSRITVTYELISYAEVYLATWVYAIMKAPSYNSL